MKKIGILSVMVMLLLAVGVSATPFVVDKDVFVTGDYVWNSGWTLPDPKPVTAWYNFDASSPLATVSGYTEAEVLGTPWKYSLDMNLGANSAGWTRSQFTAVTVNDPVEYPIVLDTALNEDAYTHYNFVSNSQSKFSASSLSISGIGYVNVGVLTYFDDAFTQFNHVGVNE